MIVLCIIFRDENIRPECIYCTICSYATVHDLSLWVWLLLLLLLWVWLLLFLLLWVPTNISVPQQGDQVLSKMTKLKNK